MAASGKRPPRVDVRTMYPNFYAEQHKHHVQENSTMAVTRKHRENSGGSVRREGYRDATRPPSRNGILQLKQRDKCRSGDGMSTRQIEVSSTEPSSGVRGSSQVIPPICINRSSNQQESTSPALNEDRKRAFPRSMAQSLRPPSRQVALRGELSLTSPAWEENKKNTFFDNAGISPRLRPLPYPTTLAGSARSLLEAATARLPNALDGETLQDFVMNTRPRTRYTRRELHRQGSAHTLARISTAPMTLHGRQYIDSGSATARDTESLITSRSAGVLHDVSPSAGLSRRPPSRQTSVVDIAEAALPGAEIDDSPDEDGDANFFLTELEAAAQAASAAAAAKRGILARHVALGSFLLYGDPPAFVAAIQHFTAAIKLVEPFHDAVFPKSDSPANLALTSLLHHHRGIALRELVVASSSATSKAAMACIKYAFAAQRRALELAQRAQDPRLHARAVKALGLLLLDAHAYGPALTHQQEALQIALEEKDRELEARVYANLGNLALAQLNFGHALSCHHRDLQLCSAKVLDCRLGQARAHRNLSIVYAKLHRREQQLTHEKESHMAGSNSGGAYLYDIANHTSSSIGNICFQSSSDIDPALVVLVSQNLAEIVRGLSAQPNIKTVENDDNENSISSALAEEWRAVEVDLKAALAAVSTGSEAEAVVTEAEAFAISPKSPSAISRHVSIRIDNYASTASPMHSEESLQSQEP
ncbi:unnamed protein product [Phytophthora lilii]|uniref:Unnamed protein product n=1 Tax=Phytophthora lilii TaxID=2077276 RepID=A0A9W6X7C8_9STRA|nr:unnamed protein product [Phytophthora lilii]